MSVLITIESTNYEMGKLAYHLRSVTVGTTIHKKFNNIKFCSIGTHYETKYQFSNEEKKHIIKDL